MRKEPRGLGGGPQGPLDWDLAGMIWYLMILLMLLGGAVAVYQVIGSVNP